MQSQELLLALVLLAPFAVGYLLPKVSAYFLGPAFLVAAAVGIVGLHKYFVPFQSDGSPAGMLVPAIMWAAFVAACIAGVVLILTGRMRLRRQDEPRSRPLIQDRAPSVQDGAGPTQDGTRSIQDRVRSVPDPARSSNTRAAFSMFNVALGIAVLIGPFLPIYQVISAVYFALSRSVGIVGSQLFLFLCTYFLPAFALYFGFRFAGLQPKFALSTRGSLLILSGSLVVLLFEIAVVARMASSASMSTGLMLLTHFRALAWLARAGVLIGLFLFWRSLTAVNGTAMSGTEL